MLFFDELAQISAEQIATIDIIMQNLRCSNIPFGGILILGTMDHTQIQPINQLPFLTSSLVLTCFYAVELCHSVRAHGDIDFQRLQQITRMDPFSLMEDIGIKDEFFRLAGDILTFVENWDDCRIRPNMMRAFSRVRPAQEALTDYRESIKRQLQNESITYRIAFARNNQRNRSTSAEYGPANQTSIRALNKELKEPLELVFFAGGVYECTINDPAGRFNQSQLAFMLDLPSQESVDRFDSIPLWIPPAGTQFIDFNQQNLPTHDDLRRLGWSEVLIGCAPERLVMARGGLQAKRLQYSLKHIGAITINKSQGETLPLGLAVEVTEEYSPWEKGQIVVLLSRTTTAKMTVIVGGKHFAIQKMWELITKGNEWTRYTSCVLNLIQISTFHRSNNDAVSNDTNFFDYPVNYPFRLSDGNIIPTDTTGFVYCLVSTRNNNLVYIGQTTCLSQRLIQHNSGRGSQSTHDISNRPWAKASYICGLSHMNTIHRMSLERKWKSHIEDLRLRGYNDSYSWINGEKYVIEVYNEEHIHHNIRFIRCVTLDMINTNNV